MTAREIDIHTLPSMLTALRLPSFHKLWAEIATRADTEGWPAARFLAVLAEYELAERDMRRIRRHLNEAQLPAGKTLATFDFKALVPIEAARATPRLTVPFDPESWLADRKARLTDGLDRLAKAARSGAIPGGSIENGVLKVDRLPAAVPEAAEALVLDLYDRLPGTCQRL
jgi:hypothetical protein